MDEFATFSIFPDQSSTFSRRAGKLPYPSKKALCDVKNVLLRNRTSQKLDDCKSSRNPCKNPPKEIVAPSCEQKFTPFCEEETDNLYEFCGGCGYESDEQDIFLRAMRAPSTCFDDDDIKYLKSGMLHFSPPSPNCSTEEDIPAPFCKDYLDDMPFIVDDEVALPPYFDVELSDDEDSFT